MNNIKTDYKSIIEALVIAFIAAMIFRSFFFEPFHIPSGSMKPTLEVGDYIFVSKYSYGYSRYSLPFGVPIIKNRIFAKEPERGDVVVFRLPSDTGKKYIKRIIGLPGDKIQVQNGVVYINDEPTKQIIDSSYKYIKNNNIKYVNKYTEILPNNYAHPILDINSNHILDNTRIYLVPENHFFVMGDNRDDSSDSRTNIVGFVPYENIIGKAQYIFMTEKFPLFKFWEWFNNENDPRIFSKIL